ncbi:hypothetical protein pdam_00009418 [Pocillopora damicornis]|uniref:Uncharacterized protein n=1 Tax=Pocillopora damicornis TaxID=46731 RepID=A0A3M6TLL8_POCDA|nr:hypothetical protein pdam_00009418 [Pocillopora damicornis]
MMSLHSHLIHEKDTNTKARCRFSGKLRDGYVFKRPLSKETKIESASKSDDLQSILTNSK